MKQVLLNLTVVVEPDRQRLARFVIDAVEALGGNPFAAAARLDALLKQLRDDSIKAEIPIEVSLQLDDVKLSLTWPQHREILSVLAEAPPANTVTELAKKLKNASESADMALMMLRNQQISVDLERAKQRAAAEMAQLEEALEKKKGELLESIREGQTDSLTGLYNRGAYDSRLREAVLRCQRQREPLCLIMLDLDYFKQINDTHGHQHGDEYLKRMAKAMRQAVRDHVDHVCRMGGDEFAIVLFSNIAIATRAAEKILQLMEKRVSIGIAPIKTDDTVDSFIARTDAALYEAKHRGRGQFVVAGTMALKEAANGA
ncbi:MAG: GGDEF domain-containing protein [Pseudomonadota bacterium]